MNDETYAFIEDVKTRKDIARSARYVTKGGGRKAITLRQDTMTEAEIRKEHGKIMSYNLSRPMKWKEYKLMPDDLKREYMTALREKYYGSIDDIAAMFGVSTCTIVAENKSLHIKKMPSRRKTEEEKKLFEKFLAAGAEDDTPEEKAEEEQPIKTAKDNPWTLLSCAIIEKAIDDWKTLIKKKAWRIQEGQAEIRDIRRFFHSDYAALLLHGLEIEPEYIIEQLDDMLEAAVYGMSVKTWQKIKTGGNKC